MYIAMPRHAARSLPNRLQDTAKAYAKAHIALREFQALDTPIEAQDMDYAHTEIKLRIQLNNAQDELLTLAKKFK